MHETNESMRPVGWTWPVRALVVVEDVKDGGMGASETKSRRGIRPLSVCLICCLVSRRERRRRG